MWALLLRTTRSCERDVRSCALGLTEIDLDMPGRAAVAGIPITVGEGGVIDGFFVDVDLVLLPDLARAGRYGGRGERVRLGLDEDAAGAAAREGPEGVIVGDGSGLGRTTMAVVVVARRASGVGEDEARDFDVFGALGVIACCFSEFKGLAIWYYTAGAEAAAPGILTQLVGGGRADGEAAGAWTVYLWPMRVTSDGGAAIHGGENVSEVGPWTELQETLQQCPAIGNIDHQYGAGCFAHVPEDPLDRCWEEEAIDAAHSSANALLIVD